MRTHSDPIDGDIGRQTGIAHIERAIASRWWRKDGQLQIVGIPKRIIGSLHGFTIYRVDSNWIRDNLDVTFGTGGHGLVHTFIPLNEIWIDPITEQPASLIFHEIMEFHHMLDDGMDYAQAHNQTLREQQGLTLTMDSISQQLTEHFQHREDS